MGENNSHLEDAKNKPPFRQVDNSTRSGYRVCRIFRDYSCLCFVDPLRSAVNSAFGYSFGAVECLVAELDLSSGFGLGFEVGSKIRDLCRNTENMAILKPYFGSLFPKHHFSSSSFQGEEYIQTSE